MPLKNHSDLIGDDFLKQTESLNLSMENLRVCIIVRIKNRGNNR